MSKPAVDRYLTFVDWLRTTFPILYEKHFSNPKKSVGQRPVYRPYRNDDNEILHL